MRLNRRFFISVCCLSAVLMIVLTGLYIGSLAVHYEEGRIKRVMAEIAQEQQKQRELSAEWSYLNSPQRLKALVDMAEESDDTGLDHVHKTSVLTIERGQ